MGPFHAEPAPIEGSYSIDPAVFTDVDGQSYLYFGGIWGGQLENWTSGHFVSGSTTDLHRDGDAAIMPQVARLTADGKHFAGPAADLVILGDDGKPLRGGDHDRRFFEASWMFLRNGVYYFTYSTGDTHFLAYATGKSPLGAVSLSRSLFASGAGLDHASLDCGMGWALVALLRGYPALEQESSAQC